jgi:hypothetical protein
MSESSFKGSIPAGTVTAEFDSDASNADADLLIAMYSSVPAGQKHVDEAATAPGGQASVSVEAGGRGVLEVWVAIGAATDRGRLRVFADGQLRDEDDIEGSVRWVYAVEAG